jgi:hypothetical protein
MSISTTSGVSRFACATASPPSAVDVLLGVEDHAEAGAHERLVVGDEHADHSGILAVTSKPPPATGPARSDPS